MKTCNHDLKLAQLKLTRHRIWNYDINIDMSRHKPYIYIYKYILFTQYSMILLFILRLPAINVRATMTMNRRLLGLQEMSHYYAFNLRHLVDNVLPLLAQSTTSTATSIFFSLA